MNKYADDTTLFCDDTGTPADENILILELCKINSTPGSLQINYF